MKRINIFIALLLLAGFAFSQTPEFNNTISIDQTFTSTAEIFPFSNQSMNSVGITGNLTLYADTSLVRIVLKDSLTYEYMVFESHPLLDTIWSFTFNEECEETCFMDGFTPTSVLIYVYGASLYVNELAWGTNAVSNPTDFQLSAKQNKVNEKLDKIKAYINKEHLIWIANHTEVSEMFYHEKLATNDMSLESLGAEFYEKGIYAIKTPQDNGQYINYDYVPSFDWRSRHGANDPNSNYYDGDPDGGGWITGFNECQVGCFVNGVQDCSIPEWECDTPNVWKGTGLCWAFGPTAHIESLINLYLNYHADINLSEQNLSSCVRDFPWTHGWHTDEAYDYYRDDGVVDEQTFPFTGDSIDCIFPPPNEKIFIDNYIYYNYYNGTGLTEEELRQNVMQNGPIGVSRYWYPWGVQGHARQLTGWDVIEWEDIYSFTSIEIPADTASYAPWVGVTYWIYKDNYGSWKQNDGFYYEHHYQELPPRKAFVIPTDYHGFVYSDFNTFDSTDVVIVDNDGDGYYNWGIGPKPQNCPPCPNEPDADDNNSGLGSLDEFGFSTIIGTYNSDFETSMNYWKQVDYDNCDWVKYNGVSFDYPYSGPNGTPNGSTNYLLMYYGNCYGAQHAYIESPPIDLSRYCQIELTFAYHKNHELWGNYDSTRLSVDISFDEGQTWQNDFWWIEEDQGDQWFYETVYMPSNVTKIRFHGYFDNTYQHHDMALDDITIGPVISDDIIIVGEEEWEGQHTICSDIVIEPNAKLTLLPGCELNMFTEAKIIIKRTAELVIDDAVITDNNNQLWQGINVWGNANQGQLYTYQGNVKIINGGVIENAVCGIQTIKFNETTGAPDYNYTGGMVFADVGTFKNCRVAAKFWSYNYNLGSSFFRDCQFITDANLLPGTDPDVFIKTTNLSRLTVIGSSFTDSRSVASPEELTSGIEASDTYLRVYENPFGSQCEFTNLYNGIRVYAHNPDKTVLLTDNLFTDNFHSVYLSTVMEPTVTGNTFTPWGGPTGDPDNSYCLYIDYCTGYTIEENIFSYGGVHPKGIGLVVNNSGSYTNEIYNNDFINLEFATLAQNNNRGPFYDEGLVIKCNDYEDNSNDIAVTANEEVEYPGIAKHQGAEGMLTEMQAGNLFSLNNNGIDYSDYSTFKESPITYFHHSPISEPRVKPIYYIDKYIYLDDQLTPYSENGSCPSHLSGGGGGGGIGRDDLKSNLTSSDIKADSTQALLTALVDGGNTDVLQQEVLQTMPQEAYDLYMSLMGKSPYLSDSVLIATIEKEYILPNVLIKDILAANPQSAKSPEVMDKVNEKAIPMTEEQLAEILLGKYIVAAKEKLESQLAYHKQQRSISLKFLKQSYRNDTVDPYANDSLVLLLETENGLQEKFELVFAYSAQNNWTGAMALMDNLPNQYSFKQHEQEMYNDYNTFINVLYELDQAGMGLEGLTATQNTSLLQLADNVQNYAGSYARNILIGTDNYPYTEPIILPGDGLKSGSITFDLPVPKDYRPEYISIYPNPAMSYIIVELNKTNLNGVNLSLYDNGGKLVKQTVIPARTQDYVIGLKGMKPGIYIIKADMDGKNIGGKKFSIIK